MDNNNQNVTKKELYSVASCTCFMLICVLLAAMSGLKWLQSIFVVGIAMQGAYYQFKAHSSPPKNASLNETNTEA